MEAYIGKIIEFDYNGKRRIVDCELIRMKGLGDNPRDLITGSVLNEGYPIKSFWISPSEILKVH